MDYHRPYAAHVHVDGVDVGSIVWEAKHLLVSGLPDQVATTAKDIAEQLGGRFVLLTDFPESVNNQTADT
jgi:hypothetical protein